MKLDTPEAKAFVKLWNDYDPYVGYDLHTSDGSYHGYYLTYSPPLNPDTSPIIMKMMTDEWFPHVTKDIKAKHGWDTFYYGNVSTPGAGRGGGGRGRGGRGDAGAPSGPPSPPATARQGRRGDAGAPSGGPPQVRPACVNAEPPAGVTREWRTFEHVPRFHNNYLGLRNRFALLSEAYAYATFEDRIKATNYFLEASLDFAHRNAARIKKAVADADRESLGAPLATTSRMKRGGTIEILMGEVEPEKNPNNGADMCRRRDVVKPEQMVDMLWFEPVTTETVPRGYYLPEGLTRAADLLKAHGVKVEPVRGALKEEFDGFAITANTAAAAAFEGHTIRSVEGKWGVKLDMTPPTSGWVVYTDQPLGRLAFYLLEPTSDDGVVAWNYLDDQLKDEAAKMYPILRIVR
jgi:hypothetical protein